MPVSPDQTHQQLWGHLCLRIAAVGDRWKELVIENNRIDWTKCSPWVFARDQNELVVITHRWLKDIKATA
eukprot:2668661-Lingulodinium_polyedra.AAC.1